VPTIESLRTTKQRASSRLDPEVASVHQRAFAALPDTALVDEVAVAAVSAAPLKTVQRLRWSGGGPPFVKMGRRVLYRVADVRAWLAARSAGPFLHTAAARANAVSAAQRH